MVHLLGVQIDPPASQADARRGVRVFVVGTAVYQDRRVVSYIVKMAHKILTHHRTNKHKKIWLSMVAAHMRSGVALSM